MSIVLQTQHYPLESEWVCCMLDIPDIRLEEIVLMAAFLYSQKGYTVLKSVTQTAI